MGFKYRTVQHGIEFWHTFLTPSKLFFWLNFHGLAGLYVA